MPPKVQKSKAQKLLAAQSASKGGKSKKKWAKSKLREKKNNRVIFTKAIYDSCLNTANKKARAITLYTLVENYKIGGSLARKLIRELLKAGSIKCVSAAGSMSVYTTTKEE